MHQAALLGPLGRSFGSIHDNRLRMMKDGEGFEQRAFHNHEVLVVHGDEASDSFMCVVCGLWSPGGEKRKSGLKCPGCVGTASMKRLRDTYRALLAPEGTAT